MARFTTHSCDGVTKITTDDQYASRAGSDPLERVILRLSRFEGLGPDEAAGLRRSVRRSALLPAYSDVFRDTPHEVTVLLTGMVCQFRLMGNGRRQITGIFVPGDICDFGFLAGNEPLGHFMTMDNSQVGRMPSRVFLGLAEAHPSLMRATLRAAATASAIAHERVISLGSRVAIERVAHLLSELRYRLDAVGLVGRGNTFDIHLTQAEIGDALGLSTVHVNRTLQILRREQVIGLRQGRVTIENVGRLHELAGFDAAYLNPSLVGS